MDLSQVLDQLEQDKDYYLTSGGGVTLSGGELMMQAGFAAEILRACRERGIAAAIETNLAYDYALLEGLLPCLDLVMADIKVLDEGRHRAFTGIGNGEIRENAARLAKTGLPYIIRSPVIPGFNDNRADIKAIAAFVRGLGGHLLYYELLGFNPLGDSKYRALGRENPYGGARLVDDELMEALVAAAAETGIPVRRG
jgi:pyruvate formate lyase activating enzyme